MSKWSAAIACAFFLAATAAMAQIPDDYFRGKTISVVIPTAPGGGRTANATPLIERLGKNIPGNPQVVPRFMPGAGGSTGVNWLHSLAPRDGTAIGTPLAGALMAQVTGEKSVQFDFSRMIWIGRTTDTGVVVYTWKRTGVVDLEGARKKELVVGATALGSSHAVIPIILNETIGTRFKVIQGYASSAAINLAVERGEIDAAATTWDNLKNNHGAWVKSGDARVLTQVSLLPTPDIGEVPLALNEARSEADRQLLALVSSTADLGQSFVAPPGVPDRVVEILRRGFDATMKDPEYVALTGKMGITLNPLTGERLTELNKGILETPASVIERYQKALAKY
jgi:tripartite-type tricarboxylate transporter receptor subunit TctC